MHGWCEQGGTLLWRPHCCAPVRAVLPAQPCAGTHDIIVEEDSPPCPLAHVHAHGCAQGCACTAATAHPALSQDSCRDSVAKMRSGDLVRRSWPRLHHLRWTTMWWPVCPTMQVCNPLVAVLFSAIASLHETANTSMRDMSLNSEN